MQQEAAPLQEMLESDWDQLIRAIKTDRCTLLIGRDVDARHWESSLASQWSRLYGYPFHSGDFARVAQFASVVEDVSHLREQVIQAVSSSSADSSVAGDSEAGDSEAGDSEADGIYDRLAALPVSLYLTTNYDDRLFNACRKRLRDPRWTNCRTPHAASGEARNSGKTHVQPSPAAPLIFHLHGHTSQPESMLLTEDDHLDCLIDLARDVDLPANVERALTASVLLFIDFDPDDWSFRVLLRTISSYLGQSILSRHFLVPPQFATIQSSYPAWERFAASLSRLNIRLCPGNPDGFLRELEARLGASYAS